MLNCDLTDGVCHAHDVRDRRPDRDADLQPPRGAQRDDLGDVRGARRRLRRVDDDAAIRVLVLRGAGGKAFVAGTDIAQFQSFANRDDGIEYEERLDQVLDRLERVTKPTIAQVQGVAAGGGCAIALTCDLRVATPESTFGIPIARTLGNCLSGASYSRLVDLLGPGRVKDMLFTGRFVPADRSARAGHGQRGSCRRTAIDARRARLRAARSPPTRPLTMRATKEIDPAHPGRAGACPRATTRHGRDVLHERGFPRRRDGVPREAQAEMDGT